MSAPNGNSGAHCWKDRGEWAQEEFGFGSQEWVESYLFGGCTCLLEDGHAGPHEWTPDGDIKVEFKHAQ
jgi:hypothetical protein